MRKLTAALLALLLGALSASVLDSHDAVAQTQTKRQKPAGAPKPQAPSLEFMRFFSETFVFPTSEAVERLEQKKKREQEKRKREQQQRKAWEALQKHLAAETEKGRKYQEARTLLRKGYHQALWALTHNDKAHYNKWLTFLKNVRDRKYKDESYKRNYRLAGALVKRLLKKYESNVAVLRDDGTVAKDPDSFIRFGLRKAGEIAATEGDGGDGGAAD